MCVCVPPVRYTHEGDKGSDESSSDSEDETKRREAAKGKWKGIGRTKGIAMVKLSTVRECKTILSLFGVLTYCFGR